MPPCCFLRQETLFHIVSHHPGVSMGTGNQMLGGNIHSTSVEQMLVFKWFRHEPPVLRTKVDIIYYMAELVQGEKEHSDWYTDC